MMDAPNDVTVLLAAVSSGDQDAKNKLFAVVYNELHNLAHNAMKRQRAGHNLQTTALVHEAFVRLLPRIETNWQDRRHFFAVAAKAIRHILVAEARQTNAAKRGGGRRTLSLDEMRDSDHEFDCSRTSFESLDVLDKALEKLQAIAGTERMCKVVELRFFVGLTIDETAEVLGISKATVKRDWEFTRAWLHDELKKMQ